MTKDYLAIVVALVLWTVAAAGWGTLVARGFQWPRLDLAGRLWLGLSGLLFILQVIHLLLPVSTAVAVVLVAIGIASLLGLHGYRMPELRFVRRPVAVLLLVGLAWISVRGLGPVLLFDSGMYHLPLIEWVEQYPIVPGLANLHDSFGFNNSNFLLAAAVDRFPFPGQGHHIVNGVLFMTIGGGFVARAIAGSWEPAPTAWARASLVFVVGAVGLAFTGSEVSSPSPVFASTLLPWAGAAELLAFDRDTDESRGALTRGVIHLVIATTVKISNAATAGLAAGLMVILAVVLWRAGERAMRRVAVQAVVVAAVVIGVWVLRGVITTGYFLYPIPWTALPVSWALPTRMVEADRAWIEQYSRYWGRNTRGIDYHLLPKLSWFSGWFRTMLNRAEGLWMVVLPSVLCLFAALRWARRPKEGLREPAIGILLIASVAGVAIWLSSAPRPDFAAAPTWLLVATLYAAQPVGLLARFRGVSATVVRVGFGIALVGLILSVNIRRRARGMREGLLAMVWTPSYPPGDFSGGRPIAGLRPGFLPLPIPDVAVRTNPGGLRMLEPTADSRCWSMPLPCTPHPEPGLRLRVAGRLDRGFRIEGPWVGVAYPSKQNTVWLGSWLRWRAEHGGT